MEKLPLGKLDCWLPPTYKCTRSLGSQVQLWGASRCSPAAAQAETSSLSFGSWNIPGEHKSSRLALSMNSSVTASKPGTRKSMPSVWMGQCPSNTDPIFGQPVSSTLEHRTSKQRQDSKSFTIWSHQPLQLFSCYFPTVSFALVRPNHVQFLELAFHQLWPPSSLRWGVSSTWPILSLSSASSLS